MYPSRGDKDFELYCVNDIKAWQPSLRDHGIDYTTNSFRMRMSSDPKYNPDSVVFLGGSDTWGVGMAYEDTYVHLISQQLGLEAVNLGVPAGGMDSAFRIYHQWQPLIKARYTVFNVTPGVRREVICTSKIDYSRVIECKILGRWNVDSMPDLLQQHLNDYEYTMQRYKNIAGITALAKEHNSHLIVIENTEEWPTTAADGMHYGKEYHTWVTEQAIKGVAKQ